MAMENNEKTRLNMRIKIILTILLLGTINCKSQIKDSLNNNIKKDNMRYFDIKKFDENKKGGEWIFTTQDGTYVRQMGLFQDNTYSEERKGKNSPVTTNCIFYKNGVQKATDQEFYFFLIGIGKEFDTHGELIKETNYDLPYKFSVEDLRNKLKKEYKIDIIDDYKTYNQTAILVNRWLGYSEDWNIYKKGVPMYQVSFFNKEKEVVILEINATDGTTIFEQIGEDTIRKELPNDQNKNAVALGNNNNDNNNNNNNNDGGNNNLKLIIVIGVFLLIMGALIYFENKRNVTFNQVGYDIN
jgi:hypothetical protein